jgi:hypothetical protein
MQRIAMPIHAAVWTKRLGMILAVLAASWLSACSVKAEKPEPEFLASAMLVRAGIDDVGMTVGQYVDRIDGAMKPDGKPVIIKGWSRDGSVYTLHAVFAEEVEIPFQWSKAQKLALMLPVEGSSGSVEALLWLMMGASLQPAVRTDKAADSTPAAKAAPPVAETDITTTAATRSTTEPSGTGNATKSTVEAAKTANSAMHSAATPELGKYLGKSAASLMADTGVSVKLNQLLGKDYAAFKERMDISGDVGQDAGYLWVTGNMPHEGGSEVAGFAVNSKTGDVVAVALVGGKQYKFYGVSKPADLPQPLREWYKQRNEIQ